MGDDAHGVRTRQNMNEETRREINKNRIYNCNNKNIFSPFPCLFGPHLSILAKNRPDVCREQNKRLPCEASYSPTLPILHHSTSVDGVCRSAQPTIRTLTKTIYSNICSVCMCNQKHRRYKFATSNGFGYTHLIPSMSASLHASQVCWPLSGDQCDAQCGGCFLPRVFGGVCKRLFAVVSHDSSVRALCANDRLQILQARSIYDRHYGKPGMFISNIITTWRTKPSSAAIISEI